MIDEEYIMEKLFYESDGILNMKRDIEESQDIIAHLKNAIEKAMGEIELDGEKVVWIVYDILQEALERIENEQSN